MSKTFFGQEFLLDMLAIYVVIYIYFLFIKLHFSTYNMWLVYSDIEILFLIKS